MDGASSWLKEQRDENKPFSLNLWHKARIINTTKGDGSKELMNSWRYKKGITPFLEQARAYW